MSWLTGEVSEVYADGVLQELSMLSWRVGAVLSLNYGLLHARALCQRTRRLPCGRF